MTATSSSGNERDNHSPSDPRTMEQQQNELIATTFQKVSSLIRNSPPNSTEAPISDSIRLKLYGYYKCATSSSSSSGATADGSGGSRPSMFDPVGRAKYDAAIKCSEECLGDKFVAMRRYLEVAASQEQTEVGRMCAEMLGQMEGELASLNEKKNDEKEEKEGLVGADANTKAIDGKGGKVRKPSAPVKNDTSILPSAATFAISHDVSISSGKASQSYFEMLTAWVNSILPAPLIPRGQLDISFLDLLYALYLCLQHILYTCLIGRGGVLCRFMSIVLPKFVMGIMDVILARYHPHQRARWFEKEIEQRWLSMTNDGGCKTNDSNHRSNEGSGASNHEVVVGLSVRSLLDLYLTSRSYPAGSEVIVVPPVNIPGMVDVMRYHDLTLVAVDLLGAADATESAAKEGQEAAESDRGSAKDSANAFAMDEHDLLESTRWGIDLKAIKAAITSKTVAILVVHPFGTIIANSSTFRELRQIADTEGLDVWEDGAQCYTGSTPNGISKAQSSIEKAGGGATNQLGYTGSDYADISFFSFGPIKTATALGGGLAVLRNVPAVSTGKGNEVKFFGKADDDTAVTASSAVEELAKTMRRIQDTVYKTQTNASYLIRVMKCLAIHVASHSRLFCGLIKSVVEKLGWEYDTFVVSLTRGFVVSSASDDGNNGKKGSKQKNKGSGASALDQRQELIQQLRRRPCMAMLALLRWRLLQSNKTYRNAAQRLERCRSFAKRLLLLKNERGNITLPKNIDGESCMYGWLFPVLVSDPQRVSKELLRMGFDVPCGMTQLKPITCGDTDNNAINGGCTQAQGVFDRILYLPVLSPNLSMRDQNKLIKALERIISSPPPDDTMKGTDKHEIRSNQKQQSQILKKVVIFSIAFIEWYFSILGLFTNIPVRRTLQLIILLGPWIVVVVGVAIFLLLALSQYMGPIYLKSSNTFARYCDMLFQSPFQDVSDEDAAKKNNKFLQSKTVLELESTKVPNEKNDPVDDAGDKQQMVLLTGATGFIGSLLLRELLLHRHSLSIPGGVIVIVRSKRGKSAQQRIDRLLSQSMFDFLDDKDRNSLVHVVEGDVTLPDCGMQEAGIEALCQRNISHIFHCAAAVSFSQPLEDAAASNITSSLQLQMLTKRLSQGKSGVGAKFVYISTAFVHGGNTGTESEPLPEEVFSLHPYDPVELYKSMLGSQSYASAAMNELGFPNTYTFSKCVCEHLLLRGNKDVDTIIVRPSIVGPAVQEPSEGWAGEKPSTIVAAACLYLKFPYNMWCFGKERVPFVPVDVVCRFVISRSFGNRCDGTKINGATADSSYDDIEDEKKETSSSDMRDDNCPQSTIVTVAWDASSPSTSSFSWLSYAFSITHLGSVCGHVNRVVAYAGLLISTKLFPWLNFRLDTFQRLHYLFVRTPFDVALDLWCQLPLKTRLRRELKALSPIIDLPMLFFPFANQSFYFKSDLVAPEDFNGERYMFSCAIAAHRFIQIIEKQRKRHASQSTDSNLREYRKDRIDLSQWHSSSSIIVAGAKHVKPKSDLWWALTQPRGNLVIRFGGWIMAKIFRYTVMEIEIDVASFQALSRALQGSPKSMPPHVVLAPTHRSFYDFLIVSFICFALPELGLDIPHIAAATDFESIPIIGWLARKSHAFFIKRDGKNNDHNLKENLSRITEGKQSPSFLEVFIEGKRSRNRTFVKPKTGFLRCLANIRCEHIIVPMTINYEGIPDEVSLVKEANTGSSGKMSLVKLAHWLWSILSGSVNIGRVHVSASEALLMPKSKHKNINEVTHAIQSCQQRQIMISNYHIKSASLALELSESVILEALLELGCPIWPETEKGRAYPQIPDDKDLWWAAMLQFGHLFGPFLATSHPMWSSWILPSSKITDPRVSPNTAVNILLSKMTQHFDLAENFVDEAIKHLQLKGFGAPEEKHVMQYLPTDSSIPMFLMRVALKDRVALSVYNPGTITCNHQHDERDGLLMRASHLNRISGAKLQDNPDAESFGAWGYQDSCFVLNVKPDGSKHVIMKGTRYSISGKPLTGLANFVEEELNVVIDPSGITFPTCSDSRSIPKSNLTTSNVAEIVALFGSDESRISLEPIDRARHGTGHTQEDMYELRTGLLKFRLPDAVVWPKNEGEIQALVSLASSNNWCLIPFGGGTNVTHSTHCPSRETDPRPMISVDMKLMNRVLWVNEEDGLVHVEAGITGIDLIHHMEKLGFTIGHEPDSYEFSTLGGWIATKASGMKQNKYGNIEDIVREVSVIGSKGFISYKHKQEKSSVGRSSIGLDLKALMLGSEGCFGIIVRAVLRIWPIAESRSHESILLANFDCGVRFMKDLSKMYSMKPASVRLLDNEQFRLGQALKERPSGYESLRNIATKKIGYYLGNLSEKSVVCATITFEGTADEVKMQKKSVRELASVHGGILAGPKVGKAGYDLTFAIAYLRDFALNYNILGESFECFVPWSKLTQVIRSTKQRIFSEHKSRALPGVPFVCSRITQLYNDGVCVYFYFCMDISSLSEPSNVFAIIERAARQEILDNGGTLSHHHGLGKLRSPFVAQIYSQGYIDALIAMKKAVDPMNTFGARNGVFSMIPEN